MRPRAAIAVLNRRVAVINSFAPPPEKILAPVSALNPCKRWSPSAPTAHAMKLFVPSVVVTNGDPRPLTVDVHALEIVGGLAAPRRSARTLLLFANTTYVPSPVR